jgi:S1-C subfamily serine protease
MKKEGSGTWAALSEEFSAACEAVQESVVAVDSGGRLAASGVCWKEGVVVTASHLVRDNGELTLLGASGEKFIGALAGRDRGRDLAFIKVEKAAGLKPVETADSSALKVGQWVLAVGRSGRGELSASLGIVARIGGEWTTWRGERIEQLIRPDVTLYRGQSGSALVTPSGRVLGINTSALVRSAAVTLPAATVMRAAEEILTRGYIARPYLGVAAQPVELPPASGSALASGVESGLLVTHVERNGPAEQAGVMLGDILVRVGGRPVDDLDRLHAELNRLGVGGDAALDLVRAGTLVSANVKVGDIPTRWR